MFVRETNEADCIPAHLESRYPSAINTLTIMLRLLHNVSAIFIPQDKGGVPLILRDRNSTKLESAQLYSQGKPPLSLTHFGVGRAIGPTPPQGNHKGPEGSRHHPSAAPALTMTPSRLRGRTMFIVALVGYALACPLAKNVSGREGQAPV